MAVLATLPLIKALVPDAIFKRGKEIVASNKLSNISFQGQDLQQASATCAGSTEGDNYSLSISINGASPPTCQCSCPAAARAKGGLCKHLVALLLVRLEKHLEAAGSRRRPDENEHREGKTTIEKRMDGKEASIFSVHGWKEIAGTFLSDKNDMNSQQILYNKDLQRVYSSEVGRTYGDAQDDSIAILKSSLYEASLDIDGKRNGGTFPESSDTVAEDMLGIFLGPSLSIAVNCGKGESQAFQEGMTNILDSTDTEQRHHCSDLPFTVTADRTAKPRKKSSLKDKVAMFFGDQ